MVIASAPHMPSRALLGKNSQMLTTCGNRSATDLAQHAQDMLRMLYEAVEVRQAAALCEDSAIRKRNLNTLDAEVDAFNNLITVQCIGS